MTKPQNTAIIFFDLADMDYAGLLAHVDYFKRTGQWAPIPERRCRVTASVLNVRDKPGTTSRVLATLPGGYVADILRTENGWHEVRLHPGLVGWVSAKYVVEL